jgi:hypothetical protein
MQLKTTEVYFPCQRFLLLGNNNINIVNTTEMTTDEKVKALFASVQEKKIAIEKAERPVWMTGGQFSYSANSAHDRINIQTITDVRKIVEVLAFLIDRKEKSENAAKELGVDYNFTWLGFTVPEWKNDLQTRVNQISIQEKRKELAEIEARLNAIISPELKAQMELEAISALLGK